MTGIDLANPCPYCGAAPYEPCRNMRRSGQAEHGSGSHVTASVQHIPTKRPHPERNTP